MTEVKIGRALLSVSDKTGLVELGSALARHGVELVSTGGTAKALRELVELLGGTVAACGFLIELTFLDGRARLADYDVHALIGYDAG